VNTAVSQLDQMTQQNAALVEESAAAAQSLKDQATRLADVVQVFKLDAATAAASAATPTTVARAAPAQTSVKASPPAKPAAAPVAAKPAKPLAAPSTAPRRAEPVATATRGSDEGEWESF
jgi:methyl-accepting chemotaxis protein